MQAPNALASPFPRFRAAEPPEPGSLWSLGVMKRTLAPGSHHLDGGWREITAPRGEGLISVLNVLV